MQLDFNVISNKVSNYVFEWSSYKIFMLKKAGITEVYSKEEIIRCGIRSFPVGVC